MTTNMFAGFKAFISLWPVFVMVVVGMIVLRLMRRPESKSLGGQYQARPYLLTKTEFYFYQALRQAIGRDLLIFAKVRLEDLVEARRDIEHRQAARNKISSKHIDFVLCDPRSIKPVALIELNDSSHNRPERIGRDWDVRTICESCGLALLEIPVKRTYEPDQLRGQILSIVKPQAPVRV